MSNFHQAPTVFISEVALNVSDLSRSVAFYKQAIGLSLLREEAGEALLTADGSHVLLRLVQPDQVVLRDKGTTGLYHVALLLPTRVALAHVFKHLLECEVALQGATNHRVSEAIYLTDPDGNGIELYADSPVSHWNWQDGEVNMSSLPLDHVGLLSHAQDERIGTNMFRIDQATILGHLHLHVAELAAVEPFYAVGMGFHVTSRMARHGALFMADGGYHHHLGLNTWNGVGAPRPQAHSTGLRYYVVRYPDEQRLRLAVQSLRALHVTVAERAGIWHVEDPVGHSIHIMKGGECDGGSENSSA